MKKVIFFFLVTFLFAQKSTAQYCTPSFTDPSDACFTYAIDVASFAVNGELGTSINDATGCSGSGYEDNSGFMSVTFAQGGNYTVTIASGFAVNVDNAQLWIDFNNNGIFELSESIGGINGLAPSGTFTASIPAGVSTGTYRMRVVLDFNGCCSTYPNIDPCASGYLYGDVHDYSATIIVPPAIVITAPTYLAFGGVATGTSSIPQSFTVTGSALAPATGNLTITPPSPDFLVSSDGLSWSSIPYTIPYTGGTLAATTVYVQFNPSALTNYSENVTITGGGLISTVNEPVSGTGATACTGTPTAGTAVVTPGFGNPITSFTLTLSGSTVSGGITYQWQSSPDNITFTDIPGATLATYGFTGISANTYYQCIETCPTFSTSTSTSILAIYIPALSCFPSGSSWLGESASSIFDGVDGFNITGYGGSTLSDVGITSAANPSTGYLDRTSMTPVILQPGSTYASSATFGNATNYQELQVWIDFNDDGTFDPSEEVTPVSGYSTSFTSTPVNFNITIPLTSTPGTHLMRIRGIFEYYATDALSTDLDPCLNQFDFSGPQYFSGTVADYLVNILPPPPTVVTAPTSLAFGGVTVGTSSFPLSFTVTGSYLLPATGTLTITPPAPDFLVSSDGITWSSVPYTIPYTSGALPATTVYVQFDPSAFMFYNENVTVTGGGLTSPFNEPVNGTGAAACSGTPTAGATVVSPSYGNATTPFTLSLTGSTIAGGITYQWQSSPDGITFTNIPGATLAGYNFTGISASTYYECVETCPTYATATSTSALAALIPTPSCFPTSASWSGESGNAIDGVDGFNITGYGGSTLSDVGITSAVDPNTGYIDRTAMTPVNLQPGSAYPSSATFGSIQTNQELQVWIDFNDDGTFDPSEEVTPVSGYSTSFTSFPVNFNVTIPLTATPGEHLMRMRGIWEDFFTDALSTDLDPCQIQFGFTNPLYYSGTVADYIVNILPAPPTIVTAPTSLAFGGVTVGTSSFPLSFTVTGSYLVPATGSLTITPPAPDFLVSSDGITWSSVPYTIPYTGSSLPATTVYVQFDPSAFMFYNENVTVTGGGLTSPFNEPVNGTGAAACSGTPTAGAAAVAPTYGNGTTPFVLSLSGNTIAGGITYQWQSSPDGVTFTDIPGATLAGYNFTGISASTYYECVETCPTYATASSTSAFATFIPLPTCLPTSASWVGEPGSAIDGVDAFNITGYSGSTLSDVGITTAADPSTGYLDRTAMTPVSLQPGSAYPSSATFGSIQNYQELQVWIDFNDDGTFDPSEEVSPVAGYNTSFTSSPVNFNITIPLTATPGEHLMRMRGIWEYFFTDALSTDLDPCQIQFGFTDPVYYSGTVADYVVNILPAPPTIVTAPTSLAFGGVTVGTSSFPLSFTVAGSYLVPATGNLIITPPAPDFLVSSDGITWSSVPYTIPYTGSSLPATTVYVQFDPSAFMFYNENVTVTGGGLTSPFNEPVNGTGAAACSGTPTAGAAAVAPTYGNGTTPFVLSLSGNTIAGGITYQWQSSPDGVTFTDIPGATLAGYNFTGISASTYYECVETCPTYATASSTSAFATFIPLPTCLPTSASWVGEPGSAIDGVDAFNITGYSGSTLSDVGITTAADPNTGYLDRTAMTPVSMQQSGVYSSSASFGAIQNYQELQVWIDFNDDGTFDPSEEVTPVAGYNTFSTPDPVTFNISIPITATPGEHLMRIRGIWEFFFTQVLSTDLDPCQIQFGFSNPEYYSGTVADYVVNIVPLPPCTGTPTAGTISADTTSACAPFTSTLSLPGATVAAGLTYQWQTSPDCTTWTPVPGATNVTYTASVTATTNYNCIVTCTTTSLSATTPCYNLILNTPPAAITGTTNVCVGNTSTLSDATTGGTWSSSDGTIAAIDMTLGTVTGVAPGAVNIIYTIPSGCTAGATFVVNPFPSAITINPGTFATICAGDSTNFTAGATISDVTLINETFNTGLDGWSVVNTGAASIYNWAVVPPGSLSDQPFVTGDGSNYAAVDGDLAGTVTLTSSLISPSFSTVGYAAASLAYNEFYNSYFGDINVEVDYSIDGGTTWATVINEISSGGDYNDFWSVGSPNITTPLPTGALGQPNVMLRWYYNSFFGNQWIVDNVVLTATPNLTYAWVGTADTIGISCASCASATITSTVVGTNVYTVTATGIGCATTNNVTVSVNPVPLAITGTLNACIGNTSQLSDATPSGTWSSSDATIASVDMTSGLVTAVAVGTVAISYTNSSGCPAIATFIVNDVPGPITGTLTVCTAANTTLADPGGVGNWTSSDITIATVGTSSGIVTGVAAGTVNISYANTCGAPIYANVTVNQTPAAIMGAPNVCLGLTTTLSDLSSGGTWSSGDPTIATIDPVSGILTTVAAGSVTITYTLGNGCIDANAIEIVIPSPVLTPAASPTSVCPGGSASLAANATLAGNILLSENFNSGLDAFTVVNTGASSIYNWAVVAPGSLGDQPFLTGDGSNYAAVDGDLAGTVTLISSLISPSFSTVGYSTVSLAYNEFYNSYSGDNNVEVDYSTDGGTTWSTVLNEIGAGDYNYTWSVGSPNIVTSLPAGALGQSNVMLRWYYNSFFGNQWAIDNVVVTATNSISYTWSPSTFLSSTTDANPTANAVTATTIYTVTASGGGCSSSDTVSITVNPLPPAISGTLTTCPGSTTDLSDATTGGTWSTSDITIATIDINLGIVSGVAPGTVTITYTLSTGCITTSVATVNPLPPAISGTLSVCVGLTTSLSDGTTGGTWSSSDGTIAAIDPSSGLVTGEGQGNATVTYTLPTGCITTATVTVNPLPTAIGGTLNVCTGLTTALSDGLTGGTWSSSDATVVSIDPSSGVATGVSVAGGTATITYTLPTGCMITAIVTVNPLPSVITGIANVCVGLTTTLNSTPSGGTWSSSNTNAIIGSTSGIVTGSIAGTATITYTLPTGCIITTPVTVNPNPTTITGNLNICGGATTTLNSTPAGGIWTSSNGNASVGPTTGIVSAVVCGTSVISYTVGTGCYNTATVTINCNPTSITGTTHVCVGLTTTLNSTPAGGAWSSSNTNAIIGSTSGILTGSIAGTATVTYTSIAGCIATTPVTVNPNPIITGSLNVCLGLTTTLNATPSGGVWSSSNGNAAVGSATGIISGIASGTSVITYIASTGCINTAIVTINANPAAITGTLNVCVGLTTALSSTPSGGAWGICSSSGGGTSDSYVNIGLSTGIVMGGPLAGTVCIVYTLPTGCSISGTVTVNPNPLITGALNVCVGSTTTLNSTPAGGTWSSSNGNATIDPATGIVSGITSGTSVITYTISTGCINTAIVTINPNPTPITGTTNVCVGLTTTLNSTPSGGIWSSSNANATVGSSTGIVTGLAAGTATITDVLGTGCSATTTVTVNPNPTTITGTQYVCAGLTTTLNSTPAGGTWNSSNGNITVGSATGIVTGITAGTSVITYMVSTGCINTAIITVNPLPTTIGGTLSVCTGLTAGCMITTVVTVNPLPAPISGALTVCAGLTTSLSDIDIDGTWSGSGFVSVGSSTGIVTGIAGGSGLGTVTYTLPTGCITTAIITVNPLPSFINGSLAVCAGLTTTLTDGTSGGTWSSSSLAVATIGSGSGIVSGVSAGTTIITYALTATGCITTAIVTVNPLPTTITGSSTACTGATTGLSDGLTGGTWLSSTTTVATIGSGSGIVSGVLAGTTTITYTLPTGCLITTIITVNTSPLAITGSPLSFCAGLTTVLSDPTGGGAWSSSDNTIALVGSATGIVTGASGGTATITYTVPSGCIATVVVTINPLSTPITGTESVCAGLTTTLSDGTSGGTWSSSDITVATVGSGTGVVTGIGGGNATITYTLPTGCLATAIVTVNPLPTAIAGSLSVCTGLTTSLTDGLTGGTWNSSDIAVATIGSSTGIVNGVSVTLATATITYTLPTGCTITAVITVNPLPLSITGTLSVCPGLTTTLSDLTVGGTWSSSDNTIATAGSGTGVITGVASGNATITYTLPTGCIATAILTVNPLPLAITGTQAVCAGLTTSLSDAATGGTWTSGSTTVATIGSGSGLVNGVLAGTTTITYALATGCITTAVVTVNPLPSSITGTLAVCTGLTTTLSDGTPGGSWSSSDITIATAGSGTGVVTGVANGNATITYTLPTGCITTAILTVNPLPSTITGTLSVCAGLTTNLSDATTGGSWTSGITTVATVGSGSGLITGILAGTTTVTYTIATGCITTAIVTVNPLPAAISGSGYVCIGLSVTLSDAGGGSWSAGSADVTINSSGSVSGIAVGTSLITYTLPTGCIITTVITVNPIVVPGVILSPGSGDTVCSGTSVLFTAIPTVGGPATAYQWGVNGSIVPGVTTNTLTWSPSNGDVISVTMTSGAICASPATATAMDTITVIHTDTTSVSISVTPGDTVCLGSAALFTAAGINGGSSPAYLWFRNGVQQLASGTSYGLVPVNGDNIYCELVSSLRCKTPDSAASNHITMTVDTSYIPSVGIVVSPGTTIHTGETVTFTATVTNAGPVVTYQWVINAMVMPGATNDTFSYNAFSNNDSVTCLVTSVGPCGYVSFNTVIIDVVPTSVQQLSGLSDVRLIPNPNKGQFTIKGSLGVSDDDVSIEVTDMLGQVVYKDKLTVYGGNINQLISLSNTLANGMYMLNLNSTSAHKVFHFVIEQ